MSLTMYNISKQGKMLPVYINRLYSNSMDPKEPSKQMKHLIKEEYPEWREPWAHKKSEWYSSLKLFAPEKNPSIDLIKLLQTTVDFSPTAIKLWWKKRKIALQKLDQTFIKERHQILGNDLAAAHFIVHRGGAVRFYGSKDWIKKDDDDNYTLPSFYDRSKIIEAIDCSDMNLYYEGLENIHRLEKINWLSLKNCRHMDDFCVDRISGEFRNSLVYLDISGCPKITERGLVALYKTMYLKTLIVSNKKRSTGFELTCSLLEELYPRLNIISQD